MTGDGAWRSLNPTDSEIGDAFFEQADTDLTGTAELASLHVTGGSNVLWSRNAEVSAEDELWTYEDTLAAPVVLTLPKNGGGLTDTDKVTLEWEELTGVELYEVKVNTEEDFGAATAVTVADEDDTEVTARDLDDGTKYYWKVRVKAGEPLRSPWSTVWVFTTKLSKVTEPTQRSPENGEQDVIISPSFGWNTVGDSTSYDIEVSASPDFASLVTSADTAINSWAIDTTLSYSATYYWRVRALKDDLVISGWRSAIFTTMAKPVTPPPPVEILPPPPPPPIPPAPPPSPPQSTILPYIWAMISITSALLVVVLVLIIRSR